VGAFSQHLYQAHVDTSLMQNAYKDDFKVIFYLVMSYLGQNIKGSTLFSVIFCVLGNFEFFLSQDDGDHFGTYCCPKRPMFNTGVQTGSLTAAFVALIPKWA
jgi:hypothetical protein